MKRSAVKEKHLRCQELIQRAIRQNHDNPRDHRTRRIIRLGEALEVLSVRLRTRRYVRLSDRPSIKPPEKAKIIKKTRKKGVKIKPLRKQLEKLRARQAKRRNPHRAALIAKLEKKITEAGYSHGSTPTTQGKSRRQSSQEFYESREWQELRYRVLKHYGVKCMCCHATGCEMHVDHIRPRSKYPELELDFNNMQILCRPCNMGKGAWDETDFRAQKDETPKKIS